MHMHSTAFGIFRTEWIDAISKVSKELTRKTDVEPASLKPPVKTEGATIAKQGIKVLVSLVTDAL